MTFSKNDTVEAKTGIWIGDVGTVEFVSASGNAVMVRFPGEQRAIAFCPYEIRHSQQKLEL